MVYNPATDFVGLWRLSGGNVAKAEMPGLDFLDPGAIDAAAAGRCQTWIENDQSPSWRRGQTASPAIGRGHPSGSRLAPRWQARNLRIYRARPASAARKGPERGHETHVEDYFSLKTQAFWSMSLMRTKMPYWGT